MLQERYYCEEEAITANTNSDFLLAANRVHLLPTSAAIPISLSCLHPEPGDMQMTGH